MAEGLSGPNEVLAYIAKTVDNIDPERTDVPTWRNSEVLELLEDIAAGLRVPPEWAEVTISDVLAERADLQQLLAEHEITDAIAAEIFTAGIRQVEAERDEARAAHARAKAIVSVARAVAAHWKDAYEARLDENSVYAIGTHPLALVMSALDGATDPVQLAVPADVVVAALA